MNMHAHLNKIAPSFGFGWTKYRGDGSLIVLHFDFYRRSLAVHLDFAVGSDMGPL